MNSQADALGQIAGGPLLGWLAVAVGSTRPAMLAVAAILAPSLYLYLRTIRLLVTTSRSSQVARGRARAPGAGTPPTPRGRGPRAARGLPAPAR